MAAGCEPKETPTGDGLCSKSIHTVFFTRSTYRPGSDGAVSGLEARVQVKASAPVTPPPATGLHAHPSIVNVYLAFRQDGVTYWRRPLLLTDVWIRAQFPEGDWNFGAAEIGLDDEFVHYDESGEIVNGGPNFVEAKTRVACVLDVDPVRSPPNVNTTTHPHAVFST